MTDMELTLAELKTYINSQTGDFDILLQLDTYNNDCHDCIPEEEGNNKNE